MSQQLTEMAITRVSVVDKGANLRRFAVFKRDEEGSMTDLAAPPADTTTTGIAAWLRKAADALLGKQVEVAKTETFADIVAGQELSDALYDGWETLRSAIWGAIYAYDADGQPVSQEGKRALVAQNLDEFKAWLLARMDQDVEKSAGSLAGAPSRHVAAIVAKVGRKISGSRLERLQAAAEALSSVLAEVAEAQEEDAEEEPVEKTELVAAITEAIEKSQKPIVERLEALEKSASAGKPEGDDASGDDAPITLETIAEALGAVADRVGSIEKSIGAGGGRTSIAGQDGGVPVKKSVWAGAF